MLHSSSPRAVVVSASMGGGHDGAARELRRRLTRRGWDVQVYDYLDALPVRLGRALRSGYHAQLRVAPSSYDRLFRVLGTGGSAYPPGAAAHRDRRSPGEKWVEGADVVVSTCRWPASHSADCGRPAASRFRS